jgi:phosphohistidine phosphatase
VATISFVGSPDILILRRGVELEVYFLRHGEAGKRMAVAEKDSERGLTESGQQEVKEIGDSMADLGLKFDVVATSPLKRSKETAMIVNKALKRKDPVEEWTELLPEGSREALYRKLGRQRAGTSILVVGHEPYLTTAINELASKGNTRDGGTRILLKKGGLARVSLSGSGARVSGELRWLLSPKLMRKMAD